ncbi:proton-translocating NADH-quinone oxidoreductase, chain M [Planctopirus limnophila DSM 3776]|uniref:Proton-translocating NADH-quinone oxidoreductase, chain M n=1 Tax=Planctopirus limnophila (strain ATCC 43296 / DSM 3776 / IFAM 1008 / Mu 290) TaxID=521674 RepID=D5SX59_PLAL2|nr:NADH-quinone oxidoreductase subunit M [Planctopirus limnophila]ADG69681.1 proton-translocating NADH-quinone oxidoreductase, chain M [Planctopirus limnophila DSM 3776]
MTTLVFAMLLLPAIAAVLMLVLDAKATAARARGFALVATVATLILSWSVAYQLPATSQQAGPVTTRWEWRHTWLTLASPAPAPTVVSNEALSQNVVRGQSPEESKNPASTSKPQDPSTARSPSGDFINLEFYLGLDGLGMAMILLTTGLCVSAILVSWSEIRERSAEFYAGILILEAGLIGVFLAYDLILFYAFFEFTLLPLFLTIGVWGGPKRRYAAGKFFIYTLAGSLVMLLGLVSLVVETQSLTGISTPFSMPDMARALQDQPLPVETQTILFLLIATGFLIKVPMFPFHTWLPLVHVEAPTAGSVDLAGVLLKLGCYGFLRIAIPMLPDASLTVGQPLVAILAVIGVVYGSLCAYHQTDIKRMVAYSSIAHLGVCMLGLFALNAEGLSGGICMMINHGLATGALFSLVGMIHERYHTRSLTDLGGLASRIPVLSALLVFISFASIGLPGLNGFIGEILSLLGMFQVSAVYAVIGTTGVVLSAWYLLRMVQVGLFGPLREPAGDHSHVSDLTVREGLAIWPLALACLGLGLFPQTLLNLIEPDVKALAVIYQEPDEVIVQKTAAIQPSFAMTSATSIVTSDHAVETISSIQTGERR